MSTSNISGLILDAVSLHSVRLEFESLYKRLYAKLFHSFNYNVCSIPCICLLSNFFLFLSPSFSSILNNYNWTCARIRWYIMISIDDVSHDVHILISLRHKIGRSIYQFRRLVFETKWSFAAIIIFIYFSKINEINSMLRASWKLHPESTIHHLFPFSI